MNAFQLVMIGLFAGLLLCILALGRWSPRSASELLDWKPARSAELEAQDESDDAVQMLAAQNALRRRRGLPDRTVADVEESLRRDRAELDRAARRHDRPGRS